MSVEMVEHNSLEKALIVGDLASLSATDRILYYKSLCNSLGLNPLTKPFEYMVLRGKNGQAKLTLYAKRDCADQLRKINGVSISISSREIVGDSYIVTAKATDKTGRTDEDTGVVTISNLKGDAFSNALMIAETKAKRRVTLSICGLGFLDETETSSIPNSYLLQEEKISDSIVMDAMNSILQEIKGLIKNDKIQDAYARCESLSPDHKGKVWLKLEDAERLSLKKHKEKQNGANNA